MGINLAEKHCVACHSGGLALDRDVAQQLLAQMSGWAISSDGTKISRDWKFRNFIESLEFVNQVSVLAEAENHHPDISFGWGYVSITLMTHSIGGLHENDFVLAAKINTLGKN